jgi:hypothetical protein
MVPAAVCSCASAGITGAATAGGSGSGDDVVTSGLGDDAADGTLRIVGCGTSGAQADKGA